MTESPKEYDSLFMTWENRSFLEAISHTGAVFSLRVFINVWKHFFFVNMVGAGKMAQWMKATCHKA